MNDILSKTVNCAALQCFVSYMCPYTSRKTKTRDCLLDWDFSHIGVRCEIMYVQMDTFEKDSQAIENSMWTVFG